MPISGKLTIKIGTEVVAYEPFSDENINNLIVKAKILKKDYEKLVHYRLNQGHYPETINPKTLKVQVGVQAKMPQSDWHIFKKAMHEK